MPRLGSGLAIGLPHINAWPDVGCSKPAMMRSNVDLPQPDAPIRQMNSPLVIDRFAPLSAVIVWSCSLKILETSLISTMGSSAMMVGTPAQEAIADGHDHAVREVARDADHDHAADDELGARKRAPVHDHCTQPLRHAGHLADHDHEPGETEAEPETREDRRYGGRQHDLVELRVAAATKHRGRLEELRIDGAHAEDRVEQDRIEGAEADQRE